METTCLHQFTTDISHYSFPSSLDYPFNYEPHPIAKIAAFELMEKIDKIFGIQNSHQIDNFNNGLGKMFGVLVVEKKDGGCGYLAGFSGKLYDKTLIHGFVPPIFDTLDENGFYKKGEEEISKINQEIGQLLDREEYLALKRKYLELEKQSKTEIADYTRLVRQAKNERKIRRSEVERLEPAQREALLKQLEHESIRQHYTLKDLKRTWRKRLEDLRQEIETMEVDMKRLKSLRQQMSAELQLKLFKSYSFLNKSAERKNLLDIFEITGDSIPPSGAGECAAPKLFQYAFMHDLKPLALAEFWYGKSPTTEIRKHGNFYPACTSKCKPILRHMLSGLAVKKNPLIFNPAHLKDLPVIYEDDYIIAVNKPCEMLAVPGKEIEDSVYTRIKTLCKFSENEKNEEFNPMIVHRLDMSTSGVMILAKTKETHRILQAQFIKRQVKKRYVALLAGIWKGSGSGVINLPLRVDLDHRPRQMVCYTYGKKAITHWEVGNIEKDKTRVYFYPITGRTHQLRVHASHPEGLNIPIYGDDLYGERADRLYLHAESLEFIHPTTGEKQVISAKVEF